ncbi:MAG: TrbI/VirB10 family protein [Rhodospirillales bacterium]
MAGFGEGSHPRQPMGRNWRSIGLVAGTAGMATAAFVWLSISGRPEPAANDEPRPLNTHTQAELPARNFETGYRQPPPPPPVQAPAPVMVAAPPQSLAPIAPIATRTTTTAAPPVAPKPMLSMFATTADGTAFVPVAGETPATLRSGSDSRPGISDGVDRLDEDQRQGLSAQKNRWLATAGTGGDDVVTQPFLPPVSKYMLQAATIIRATTLNEVNSDLPGDVAAIVTEDVRDTPTGRHVLIPAASKLYGRYNDQLSYGQRRAQIGWTRILFPDGSSQNIGSMAGTDAAGAAGIEGEVDRHVGSMAGAIAGTAFFTLLSQAGTLVQGDGGTTNIGVVGAGAAGNAAAQVGSQFISRELNRPNTLVIPQGSTVAVMLSKDLALPPYQAHPWARQ